MIKRSRQNRQKIVHIVMGGALGVALLVGWGEGKETVWAQVLVQHRYPGQSRNQGVHMAQYRRLSLMEREELSRMLAAGSSLRAIGQALSRAPGTLSRELARQHTSPVTYRWVG
jgi:hypothetical protein